MTLPMNTWRICLLVFIGAGAGANARFWLTAWMTHRYGVLFPWGTLTVNTLGSLLIGVFAGVFAGVEPGAHPWRLLLAVGGLGGFTTFSTFSLETVQLLRDQQWAPAIGYILASTVISIAGCGLGFFAARALNGTPGMP